jgi:dCMP deaminase
VTWGYNGAPPGLPHCSENQHGWLDDEEHWGEDVNTLGCRNATHAEANALAFAARQGISTDGGTLYVTLSPCENCARLLLAAGVVRVVYEQEYREDRGLALLKEAGVECLNGIEAN